MGRRDVADGDDWRVPIFCEVVPMSDDATDAPPNGCYALPLHALSIEVDSRSSRGEMPIAVGTFVRVRPGWERWVTISMEDTMQREPVFVAPFVDTEKSSESPAIMRRRHVRSCDVGLIVDKATDGVCSVSYPGPGLTWPHVHAGDQDLLRDFDGALIPIPAAALIATPRPYWYEPVDKERPCLVIGACVRVRHEALAAAFFYGQQALPVRIVEAGLERGSEDYCVCRKSGIPCYFTKPDPAQGSARKRCPSTDPVIGQVVSVGIYGRICVSFTDDVIGLFREYELVPWKEAPLPVMGAAVEMKDGLHLHGSGGVPAGTTGIVVDIIGNDVTVHFCPGPLLNDPHSGTNLERIRAWTGPSCAIRVMSVYRAVDDIVMESDCESGACYFGRVALVDSLSRMTIDVPPQSSISVQRLWIGVENDELVGVTRGDEEGGGDIVGDAGGGGHAQIEHGAVAGGTDEDASTSAGGDAQGTERGSGDGENEGDGHIGAGDGDDDDDEDDSRESAKAVGAFMVTERVSKRLQAGGLLYHHGRPWSVWEPPSSIIASCLKRATLSLGDLVVVHPSIARPRFKWGKLSNRDQVMKVSGSVNVNGKMRRDCTFVNRKKTLRDGKASYVEWRGMDSELRRLHVRGILWQKGKRLPTWACCSPSGGQIMRARLCGRSSGERLRANGAMPRVSRAATLRLSSCAFRMRMPHRRYSRYEDDGGVVRYGGDVYVRYGTCAQANYIACDACLRKGEAVVVAERPGRDMCECCRARVALPKPISCPCSSGDKGAPHKYCILCADRHLISSPPSDCLMPVCGDVGSVLHITSGIVTCDFGVMGKWKLPVSSCDVTIGYLPGDWVTMSLSAHEQALGHDEHMGCVLAADGTRRLVVAAIAASPSLYPVLQLCSAGVQWSTNEASVAQLNDTVPQPTLDTFQRQLPHVASAEVVACSQYACVMGAASLPGIRIVVANHDTVRLARVPPRLFERAEGKPIILPYMRFAFKRLDENVGYTPVHTTYFSAYEERVTGITLANDPTQLFPPSGLFWRIATPNGTLYGKAPTYAAAENAELS